MTLVNLPQAGRRLPVAPGQTILEAALAARIDYPHSCRSGRCGACKSRLVSGRVASGPYSRFALSPEEQAAGLILACRSVPEEDVTVAWLAGADEVPTAPVTLQRATVVHLSGLTHDIRGIRLKLEDRAEFDFLPGQYVRFTMPGAPPRDYSIASRPDEEFLELHVRAVPGGRTSPRILYTLRIGDEVMVEGPFGMGFLRASHNGPIVAVAGGSGLAPIKSIVESALMADPDRRVHLYFGGRTERDVYYAEHFIHLTDAAPNFTYVPVLSAEAAPGWRTGLVSEALSADLDDIAGAKAYVAGPPAMVDAVGAALLASGIAPTDIHADVFFTPETNDATLTLEANP